jgi:hypothetical protein
MNTTDLKDVFKIRYVQSRKKRQRRVANEFRATRKSVVGFVTQRGGSNARRKRKS